MTKSRIAALGTYAPQKVLTNADLEKMVDTSDEWIVTRTGMSRRHVMDDGECTSDLAAAAARVALEKAGVTPEEVELIIVATITPDMIFPATACRTQGKLGAVNAAAFDVGAACSGFVYGLSTADQYIRNGTYSKVLVIGAEGLTNFVNWDDRNTCVLFGDGAGAALVTPAENGTGEIMSTHMHSDGSLWELLYVPAGGTYMPASHDTVDKQLHAIKMAGSELFKVAVKSMADACLEALEHNDVAADEVAYIIPHQANIRIIQAVANRLKVSMDKVYVNLDEYGNTSAASIPLALNEAVDKGKVRSGDLVLFTAFGGGLTWGSALIRW